MRKLLLAGIVLIPGFVFAESAIDYTASAPKDIKNAIKKVEKLNDKCRGGHPDKYATWDACDKREQMIQILKDAGWCYGSEDSGTAYAHYRWLPCELKYDYSADDSTGE